MGHCGENFGQGIEFGFYLDLGLNLSLAIAVPGNSRRQRLTEQIAKIGITLDAIGKSFGNFN